MQEIMVERLVNGFNKFEWSISYGPLLPTFDNPVFSRGQTLFHKLNRVLFNLGLIDEPKVLHVMLKEFRNFFTQDKPGFFILSEAASLLILFKNLLTEGEVYKYINVLCERVDDISDIEEIERLERDLGITFEPIYQSDEYREQVLEAVFTEMESLDPEELEGFTGTVYEIIDKYGLDEAEIDDRAEELIEAYAEDEGHASEFYDDHRQLDLFDKSDYYDTDIDNIFESLR